ncbi:D-alanyl-D-alanine carboxypeptidase/D-alanyl-D-alanine endopeptidase [Paraburkholderia hayleyella]|uniref:D-alanyl-D-alanine carboxypeptidase/D-alanyl-D-alanine endopeptidase n=1 Tax=Paraburkholderia hayleyella TaxID=2152889 RepID=UPI00129161FF|nr:D-alanyl-D-alanine carboxypeptidase/D-alanyl-D-alanine-endopeptidase [Paraburkholderia hayleyella]
MTHAFLVSLLSQRTVPHPAAPPAPNLAALSQRNHFANTRRHLLVRAAALLLASSALLGTAPAEARKKAPHPSVNASTILPPAVMAGLQRARIPLPAVSVVIEKIGEPTPIVALNAGQPMMPASTMKLVTTYAGLSLLGPDYRWRTTAYADGELDSQGVLHGNLYLQGTGDPKLVPEELIDLVQKIRQSGINGIDGALVFDKRFFASATRDLPPFDSDIHEPYNVGPDPLLYAFKSLLFTLTPAPDGTVAIDVLPALSQLRLDNQLHADSGPCRPDATTLTPAVTVSPDGGIIARFSGNYPLRCGPRTINYAVLNHMDFLAGGFLAQWQQTGGTFNGTTREGAVPPGARLIATHRSPALADVVRDINKFSNNTMARNLFLTIGAVSGKPPATPEQSARVIETFLHRNGLPMEHLVLDNGAGLSRHEQVSALSLADLLQNANASPVAQAFVDSLPVVGVDGTMRRRLTTRPISGNAHIKTGTLRDVRAIAGYVASMDGTSYVIVSLINNDHAEAGQAAHDALLEWVYAGPTQPFPAAPAKPYAKPRKNPQRQARH